MKLHGVSIELCVRVSGVEEARYGVSRGDESSEALLEDIPCHCEERREVAVVSREQLEGGDDVVK